MKQTLIKLNEQHYIVVDDSEIKDVRPYKGRWHYEKGVAINQFPTYLTDLSECKLITHSTQPELLGEGWMQSVLPLLLSEVEEAINGYSVDELYAEHKKTFIWEPAKESSFHFKAGFNAHKELVKDKLFTVEDIEKAIDKAYSKGLAKPNSGRLSDVPKVQSEIIQSLLPKTEWEVEITPEGKIVLL